MPPIKYTYPILMKGTMSGRLILMTAYGKGTVVGSGNGHGYARRIGNFSDGWSMSAFKPFKGK